MSVTLTMSLEDGTAVDCADDAPMVRLAMASRGVPRLWALGDDCVVVVRRPDAVAVVRRVEGHWESGWVADPQGTLRALYHRIRPARPYRDVLSCDPARVQPSCVLWDTSVHQDLLEAWRRRPSGYTVFPVPPAPVRERTVGTTTGPRWAGSDRVPELHGDGWSCPETPGVRLAARPLVTRTGWILHELDGCDLVARWDDQGLSFVVLDAAGEPHPGVWSWDDVVAADARLAWARVLASAADRPTVPDVATTPSPASRPEAETAFAEACATSDWRVGVWALRGALPERLIGLPPWAVLRLCPAPEPGTSP